MARKTQKKKTAPKTPKKQIQPKINAIDIEDMLDTFTTKKHKPLNLARFDKKLSEFVKNSPYKSVAKRLIEDYKNKKLIASEFKFNEDVIRIIKHQIKSK